MSDIFDSFKNIPILDYSTDLSEIEGGGEPTASYVPQDVEDIILKLSPPLLFSDYGSTTASVDLRPGSTITTTREIPSPQPSSATVSALAEVTGANTSSNDPSTQTVYGYFTQRTRTNITDSNDDKTRTRHTYESRTPADYLSVAGRRRSVSGEDLNDRTSSEGGSGGFGDSRGSNNLPGRGHGGLDLYNFDPGDSVYMPVSGTLIEVRPTYEGRPKDNYRQNGSTRYYKDVTDQYRVNLRDYHRGGTTIVVRTYIDSQEYYILVQHLDYDALPPGLKGGGSRFTTYDGLSVEIQAGTNLGSVFPGYDHTVDLSSKNSRDSYDRYTSQANGDGKFPGGTPSHVDIEVRAGFLGDGSDAPKWLADGSFDPGNRVNPATVFNLAYLSDPNGEFMVTRDGVSTLATPETASRGNVQSPDDVVVNRGPSTTQVVTQVTQPSVTVTSSPTAYSEATSGFSSYTRENTTRFISGLPKSQIRNPLGIGGETLSDVAGSIRAQMVAIEQTPSIRIPIHVSEVSISRTRSLETSLTSNGPVKIAGTSEPIAISISGKSHVFITSDQGIHVLNFERSAGYRRLMALLHFYQSSGVIVDPRNPSQIYASGSVDLYHDGVWYNGAITDFGIGFDSNSPNSCSVSLEFSATGEKPSYNVPSATAGQGGTPSTSEIPTISFNPGSPVL